MQVCSYDTLFKTYSCTTILSAMVPITNSARTYSYILSQSWPLQTLFPYFLWCVPPDPLSLETTAFLYLVCVLLIYVYCCLGRKLCLPFRKRMRLGKEMSKKETQHLKQKYCDNKRLLIVYMIRKDVAKYRANWISIYATCM